MEENMSPQTATITQSNIHTWKPALAPIKEKIIPQPQQNPFDNEMSKFVYYRTYSRWDDGKMRRETWEETVARAVTFLKKSSKNKLKKSDYELIHQYIKHIYYFYTKKDAIKLFRKFRKEKTQ